MAPMAPMATAAASVVAPSTTVTQTEIGDHLADDAWLFTLDTLHEVEITLPEASVAGLLADPYAYVEGAVRFDGIDLPRVGDSRKGWISSFACSPESRSSSWTSTTISRTSASLATRR